MWTEDVIEHHGEFFDFQPVMFNPKPVQQPQPGLLIGGDGAAAKRRAALVGDALLPMTTRLRTSPRAMTEINEKRVPLLVATVDDPDRRRCRRLQATSSATARPASTVPSCTPSPTVREALDQIRRYGDETLAKLDLDPPPPLRLRR